MPKKGDIIELQIDRMAFGGQGIARMEGLVIFVKGAVPGDRVMAFIYKKKKAYAEAKIQELLHPSPDRIQAPCPYFGVCGGCQWQHVTYERQLEYKRGHVGEALSHIGSLSGIKVHAPIPSEKQFAYRNKMEFSFSDRPWLPHPPQKIPSTSPLQRGEKVFPPPLTPPTRGGDFFEGVHFSPERPGPSDTRVQIPSTNLSDNLKSPSSSMGEGKGGGDLVLGLHVPGTFDKIIDVDACLLQQERGNEILRQVKRFALRSGLPPYGIKSH